MMTPLRRSFVAAVAFYALFAACGETITQPVIEPPPVVVVPPPAPVTAGVVVTGPARLTVGRQDTVRATARTSAGVVITGKTATWISNNTAVTVGTDGVVRAVAPGTAVISATIDGVTGTITIVSSDASLFTLTLTGPTAPLVVGGTAQFTITGRDSSGAAVAIRSTTWASSNPNVATVSSTGLVRGVGLGTAVISVEGVTNTAVTSTATVTVVPVPVASVAIAPYDSLLRFRFPKQLVFTARDSAGNVLQRPITYKSSNVDIAVLDEFGTAIATGQGPVTITATSEGKTATARLFVPSDSGIYVATVGGSPGDIGYASVDVPNATTPTTLTAVTGTDSVARFNFIASNGSYRVRANSSVDPTVGPAALAGISLLVGAQTSPVPVSLRPPSTVVSIRLRPYTATITAPASVGVNATFTVSWTFDETTQPFSFFPDRLPTGILYYSTTSGLDLAGTPLAATVTRDATTGISTFSATLTAPSTPGTIYFQVSADGPVSRLLFPIVYRSQALRTITVQ